MYLIVWDLDISHPSFHLESVPFDEGYWKLQSSMYFFLIYWEQHNQPDSIKSVQHELDKINHKYWYVTMTFLKKELKERKVNK